MCGIAGFFGAGDKGDLLGMMGRIAHRGPDGEGCYCDSSRPLWLGHRRLAIIDLADGAQPMQSADGTIVVSFNGEIYNHLDLRRQLEARGHVFRTHHSDTEVLLHGWREWQEDLPRHLNGMFSFALWDSMRGSLFLARDRFGEKPLYWSLQNNSFYFASELAALAGHSAFRAIPNIVAQKKLLAYGFIPAPLSYWEQVFKLQPGHSLLFDGQSGQPTIKPYWQFRIEPDFSASAPAAAEELRALLHQAVKRRLMSDVPVGVFLSGGVDSSAVAAFAVKSTPHIESYAIGFEEKSYDETEPAAFAAKSFETDHRCRILRQTEAFSLLPRVLSQLDEPLGDPSILPTYHLSAFASERLKVALSGDGGDEMFGGYDTFAALFPARIYASIFGTGHLHRGMKALVGLLPRSDRNMSLDFRLRRALAGLDGPPSQWHPRWLAPLSPSEINELFGSADSAEDLYSEAAAIWGRKAGASLIDRSLEFYTSLYLPDAILQKVDRASMRNGLEVRSVFLDNDLADFARRLPPAFKVRGFSRKIILKKALTGIVPERLLRRPKKGFGIPLSQWMRALPLSGAAVPNIDSARIARMHAEHRSGAADYRLALWCWHAMASFGTSSENLLPQGIA